MQVLLDSRAEPRSCDQSGICDPWKPLQVLGHYLNGRL